MTDKGQDTVEENRIYFLDNLRTFIIFLVVIYHAALILTTYTASNLVMFLYKEIFDPVWSPAPAIMP